MRLTVCNQTNESNIAQIEIDSNAPLVNLQAMIAIELNISEEKQILMHNGKVLIGDDDIVETNAETSTIASKGLQNDDMILVTEKQQRQQQPMMSMGGGVGQQPSSRGGVPETPEELEKQSREMMADLKREMEYGDSSLPPELVTILGEDDVKAFTEYMMKANTRTRESKRKEAEMYARLERDPFDVEAQKEIERILKQKRNDDMYEQVMEDTPELIWGRVTMLYCNMELNGHKMKVFIDSGAQSSIMGLDCARQCNLEKDIDERFKGTAVGVGTQKIVGRVLQAQIKVGSTFLACSLSVLEGQKMEFIFGLDMLKRHQCVIDLKKNVLKIGTTGEEIPFLGEGDIPKQHEDQENLKQQDAMMNATDENKNKNDTTKVVAPPLDDVAAEVSGVHERPSRPATTEISGVVSPPIAGGGLGGAGGEGGGGRSAFPEAVVANLMQLGFSRERVVQALEATGGNAETAASLLFSD